MARYYNNGNGKEKKANPGAPGDVYSKEHSGMPTEKVMKEYPKASYGLDGYDDTREAIDMFASQNHRQIMKQKRTNKDR